MRNAAGDFLSVSPFRKQRKKNRPFYAKSEPSRVTSSDLEKKTRRPRLFENARAEASISLFDK